MRKTKGFLSKLKAVSNGAAMADMAFLLLVFFMATTTTEPPKGVSVDMPQAQTQGAEQDSVYVTIALNGDIYYESNLVTLNDLSDRLSARQLEKDRVVAITADKSLSYKKINSVLKVLREKEFLNVVFMAQSKKKK